MRRLPTSCTAALSSVLRCSRKAPAARPAPVVSAQRKAALMTHSMAARGAGETSAAGDAIIETADVGNDGMDPGRVARRAARKARKEAAKEAATEKEKGGAGGAKPCASCASQVHLLIRCQTDTTKQWRMLCGKCWHKASGGVPDGDADHPHYRLLLFACTQGGEGGREGIANDKSNWVSKETTPTCFRHGRNQIQRAASIHPTLELHACTPTPQLFSKCAVRWIRRIGMEHSTARHCKHRYGGLWKSKALRNGDVSVKTPHFASSSDR